MKCCREVVSGRKDAGAIILLVNARVLRFECARVQHEGILMPTFMYSREETVWREKERSMIRAVKMNIFRRCMV